MGQGRKWKNFRKEIIEEVDDGGDFSEGSIDIRMEEGVGVVPHDEGDDDEDAILDDELLSGPNIDNFEEISSTIGRMVNRYDHMCDHNENMFSLGKRFESHEEFKIVVQKYVVTSGLDIF